MFTHCLCKCFLPGRVQLERCWEVEVAPLKLRTPANCSFCKQNSELDVQFLLSFKVETKLGHFNLFDSWNSQQYHSVCVCRNAFPHCVSLDVVAAKLVLGSDVEVGRNRHQREADCVKLSRIKKLKIVSFVSLNCLQKFWIAKIRKIFENFENVIPFQTNSNQIKMKCFSSMEKDIIK